MSLTKFPCDRGMGLTIGWLGVYNNFTGENGPNPDNPDNLVNQRLDKGGI
ncbi:MAG: hypothetical protein EBE86_007335 [Hormoscilla sp. GUM202]|nr:hypothetical protein [Hormoscilla sp. GUM202]